MSKKVTKIIVCAHKKDYVYSDEDYLPVQVGKALSDVDLGFVGDDTGENISAKNISYCELTAVYWAWKNLKDVDYVGLNHYRRYFNFYENGLYGQEHTVVSSNDILSKTLAIKNVEKLLDGADLIMTKRKIYPCPLAVDYSVCHVSEDLRTLREVVAGLYPDYLPAFDRYIGRGNRLSPCNMFIMPWNIFDRYCTWLFDILSEVERRVDITSYNAVQRRIFGYMAERLLGVFVLANSLKPKYYPVYLVADGQKNPSFRKRFLKDIRKRIAFKLMLD